MGDAKISFSIGGISFSGEGEEVWLTKQLDKIIEKAPDLIEIARSLPSGAMIDKGAKTPDTTKEDIAISAKTLAVFLKEKNATISQERKFLVTSIWLQAKGQNRLATRDVTQALKDSNQRRLGNPSRELGKNITQGFIDRDGQGFFVTEQGKASL